MRKLCLSASSTNTAGNVNGCLSAEDIERRISELHKLHKGQPPSEAEINFLEHAKRLEMYGISLHNGKDSHGRDIQLGVTCIGLVVFQVYYFLPKLLAMSSEVWAFSLDSSKIQKKSPQKNTIQPPTGLVEKTARP